MTRRSAPAAMQLGFDDLLAEAESANQRAVFEKQYGHLPATMEEAVPFLRALIERHHASMLAADLETVMRLREEAHKFAVRLNNGEPGILAGTRGAGLQARCMSAKEGRMFTLRASEVA